ncbi:hypothetical protein DS832_01515 [Bombilactobacillus bombi]|uniref:Putative host cell surface-exposed lipoprotein Ltp-like HTH region domain-containing protein n=1 Tax=Bombilactobacillus bombi TaxID=1303590 RepID=A0A3R6YQ65_9LACO|nr:Ltp family lipoprotein [Bombilactobacillus bombi]RHW48270.1 hypothetical protein DS832_01515 [Bombilactobacillus bombi]
MNKKINIVVVIIIAILCIASFSQVKIGKADKIKINGNVTTILEDKDGFGHIRGTAKPGERVIFKPNSNSDEVPEVADVNKKGKFDIVVHYTDEESCTGVLDYGDATKSGKNKLKYDPIKLTIKRNPDYESEDEKDSDSSSSTEDNSSSNTEGNSNSDGTSESGSSNSTTSPTPSKPKVTPEQKNALKKAKYYVLNSDMSAQGIKEQLQYEQFSEDAIQYALDHVDNAMFSSSALNKAKYYQNNANMSPERIREQLQYEGFTSDQISFAMQHIN